MANKSDPATQIISTPQGGGALHGIGETFSPNLHTGTGNFTVPIALPPGRNEFQGFSRYEEERDVFLLSCAEDLAPVEKAEGVTRYRPRTETFSFASNIAGGVFHDCDRRR